MTDVKNTAVTLNDTMGNCTEDKTLKEWFSSWIPTKLETLPFRTRLVTAMIRAGPEQKITIWAGLSEATIIVDNQTFAGLTAIGNQDTDGLFVKVIIALPAALLLSYNPKCTWHSWSFSYKELTLTYEDTSSNDYFSDWITSGTSGTKGNETTRNTCIQETKDTSFYTIKWNSSGTAKTGRTMSNFVSYIKEEPVWKGILNILMQENVRLELPMSGTHILWHCCTTK